MHIRNNDSPAYVCDCCGTPMYTHACKINCPNCGFRFDCSDLTLDFNPKLNKQLPSYQDLYGKQTRSQR